MARQLHDELLPLQRDAHAWRHTARWGLCGRPRSFYKAGDCEYDHSGAFRVSDSPDRESLLHLIASCLTQCDVCSGCRWLSVTLAYRGVCVWQRRCPRRLFRGTYARGLNASSFLTAPGTHPAHPASQMDQQPSSPAGAGSMARSASADAAGRLTSPQTARWGGWGLAWGSSSSQGSSQTPELLIITATYSSPLQMPQLSVAAQSVAAAGAGVRWLVVEDSATTSPQVAALLSGYRHRLQVEHLAVGPTRHEGVAQRQLAFELIRSRRWRGVVYNLDDDNAVDTQLWDELRQLAPGRVGVLSVVLDAAGFGFTERPQYDASGIFRGWSAGWCYGGSSFQALSARRLGPRVFCTDFGGFAFDSALLWQRAERDQELATAAPWGYQGRAQTGQLRAGCTTHERCAELHVLARRYSSHRADLKVEWRGGETELLESLLGPAAVPEDLQPLANCGHNDLVYHNGFNRSWPRRRRRTHTPRRFCKSDGW